MCGLRRERGLGRLLSEFFHKGAQTRAAEGGCRFKTDGCNENRVKPCFPIERVRVRVADADAGVDIFAVRFHETGLLVGDLFTEKKESWGKRYEARSRGRSPPDFFGF